MTLDEAAAEARAEAEAEGRARARAAGTRKQLRLEEGQQLVAPFSLWSIGKRWAGHAIGGGETYQRENLRRAAGALACHH